MKTETKPWYLSKGVMGSAGAITAGVLGMFFTEVDAEHVKEVLLSGGTFVSGLIALVGRLKANKKIG
jgi:uncharacterized membrane protein